jgi:hypothetical protein
MVCLLRPPALAYERFELLLIDTALLALMERSISISFGMYVQNGKKQCSLCDLCIQKNFPTLLFFSFSYTHTMSFAANFIHIRDKYGPSRALEYGTSIGLSRDLMEELALLPRGAQPSDAGHLSDEQIETVAGKLQRTQDEFKS